MKDDSKGEWADLRLGQHPPYCPPRPAKSSETLQKVTRTRSSTSSQPRPLGLTTPPTRPRPRGDSQPRPLGVNNPAYSAPPPRRLTAPPTGG